MRTAVTVALLICLAILATGAWAQDVSPRSAAMGGAGKEADQEGPTQWLRNPAGLGQPVDAGLWASLVRAQTRREWLNQALWGWNDCDEEWGLDWSGWNQLHDYGLGAGYAHSGGVDTFGAGAGLNLGSGFSIGVNARHESGFGDSWTSFNSGLQYQPQTIPNLRLGLQARDFTNRLDDRGVWDFGVSWKPLKSFIVDADVRDLTDKYNTMFNLGGEYKFGEYNQYALRAGLHDYGNFTGWTGGLGYQIKPTYGIDACYIDADDCWKADFYYDW